MQQNPEWDNGDQGRFVKDGKLTEEGGKVLIVTTRQARALHVKISGKIVYKYWTEVESYAITRAIPQACRYDVAKKTGNFREWCFYHARRNIAEFLEIEFRVKRNTITSTFTDLSSDDENMPFEDTLPGIVYYDHTAIDPDIIRCHKLIGECRAIQAQTNQRPPAELLRRRNDLLDKLRAKYNGNTDSTTTLERVPERMRVLV